MDSVFEHLFPKVELHLIHEKSAAGMYTMKAAMMAKFATDKTITMEGGHALLMPMLCVGGRDVVIVPIVQFLLPLFSIDLSTDYNCLCLCPGS